MFFPFVILMFSGKLCDLLFSLVELSNVFLLNNKEKKLKKSLNTYQDFIL